MIIEREPLRKISNQYQAFFSHYLSPFAYSEAMTQVATTFF
ncbi:hypothetical protein Osc7112_0576 [Oscillatoria nigro-viridis PCC 7112]|uniref:Uncharacterized protein n=1 Tax=Phormidium nigroviride PCC 7112 TaxID=179408 RepID=K9VD53_9CYAN|nr:hypothetical protein Osc7112_0576 [Oscillatoria nigro-viridis PCC 7112]